MIATETQGSDLNALFLQCSNHAMCRELYRYSEFVTLEHFSQQARIHLNSNSALSLESTNVLSNALTNITTALTTSASSATTATINPSDLVSIQAALDDTRTQLLMARLIIGKLTLDSQRCPPNTYWQWDEAENVARCTCFFDRDCSQETTELCQDDIHPILLATMILIAVLIVFNCISRTAYDPDLYKPKTQ